MRCKGNSNDLYNNKIVIRYGVFFRLDDRYLYVIYNLLKINVFFGSRP